LMALSFLIAYDSGIFVSSGKNDVVFTNVNPFYVSDFVKLNPEVEVVSYSFEGKSIGFVNVFGGVGKNFVIRDGEYEIVARGNTSIVFP